MIQPCHWCGSVVQSDEYFMHSVCCASESCQTKKREADERMQAALDRVK
jgi:hypothetical protein